MSPSVSGLRNQIRVHVGRFEREVDAQLTKEELAAVADALGVARDGRRPSKQEMRTEIRHRTGIEASEDANGGAFRKSELETIVDALDGG